MTDSEPEVRNTAINSLNQLLNPDKNNSQELISPDLLSQKIFPTLKNEIPTAQASYKAGVALAFCSMARIVGTDFANTMIVPELMTLLQDENTELHINIVQNLKKVWNLEGTEEGDKKKGAPKTDLWQKMLEKIFNKGTHN